jgi:hypothetical protein
MNVEVLVERYEKIAQLERYTQRLASQGAEADRE